MRVFVILGKPTGWPSGEGPVLLGRVWSRMFGVAREHEAE